MAVCGSVFREIVYNVDWFIVVLSGTVERSDYNGYFEWGSGFVKPEIKKGFSPGVVKLQFTNDLCQLANDRPKTV